MPVTDEQNTVFEVRRGAIKETAQPVEEAVERIAPVQVPQVPQQVSQMSQQVPQNLQQMSQQTTQQTTTQQITTQQTTQNPQTTSVMESLEQDAAVEECIQKIQEVVTVNPLL